MPWFLGLGILDNRANAGLFCVNSNNRLAWTGWNNGSRTSAFHSREGFYAVYLQRHHTAGTAQLNRVKYADLTHGLVGDEGSSGKAERVEREELLQGIRLARATVSAEDRRVYA